MRMYKAGHSFYVNVGLVDNCAVFRISGSCQGSVMEVFLILLVAQCISLACSSFPVQLSQASFKTCTDGNVELAKNLC